MPEIARDINGKPYFPDYPEHHFNISHTRGCVCCALADSPVGVDVERIRPLKYRDQVAERFAKDEQALLAETPEEEREDLFFRLWVLKESYVKADGRGLRIPLNRFSVLPGQQMGEWNLQVRDYQDYKIAVCTREREVVWVSEKEKNCEMEDL